jgi:hypothetical protein
VPTAFVLSLFAFCSATTAIAQNAPAPIYPEMWYREDAAIGQAQAYLLANPVSNLSPLPELLFVGNTEKSRCYSENRVDVCTDQTVYEFFSGKKRYVQSITHAINSTHWQLHSYEGTVEDVFSPSRMDFLSQLLKTISVEEKNSLSRKIGIPIDSDISVLAGKGYFVQEVVEVSAPFMPGAEQAIPFSFPCEPARTGFAFYTLEGKLVWRTVFVRLNKYAQQQVELQSCQFHPKQYELQEAGAPIFLPDGTVVVSGKGFALRINPISGKSPMLPPGIRAVDTMQLQQFKKALYTKVNNANINIGSRYFLDAKDEWDYFYLMLQYFIFPEELVH